MPEQNGEVPGNGVFISVVEVVYLALMTALSTVKPREKLMLLFEKDLQKILRDFYSGRMVMLLQWCYPYRRKEKAPDRTE